MVMANMNGVQWTWVNLIFKFISMLVKNLTDKYRDSEVADTIFAPNGVAEVYPSKIEEVLAEGDFEVVEEREVAEKPKAKKKKK